MTQPITAVLTAPCSLPHLPDRTTWGAVIGVDVTRYSMSVSKTYGKALGPWSCQRCGIPPLSGTGVIPEQMQGWCPEWEDWDKLTHSPCGGLLKGKQSIEGSAVVFSADRLVFSNGGLSEESLMLHQLILPACHSVSPFLGALNKQSLSYVVSHRVKMVGFENTPLKN